MLENKIKEVNAKYKAANQDAFQKLFVESVDDQDAERKLITSLRLDYFEKYFSQLKQSALEGDIDLSGALTEEKISEFIDVSLLADPKYRVAYHLKVYTYIY